MPMRSHLRKLFISHSNKDSAWCRALANGLRLAGYDVYFAESDLHHGLLVPEIERQLATRSVFIVVLSPDAVASRWVEREVDSAILLQDEQPERVILPVVAVPCQIPPTRVFLRLYKRIAGPGDTGLSPAIAAQHIVRALDERIAPADTQRVHDVWMLARNLHASGNTMDALAAYTEALEHLRESGTFWGTNYDMLVEFNRYNEAAIQESQRNPTIDPRLAFDWNTDGDMFRRLGRTEQALAAYEQALRCDALSSRAWIGRGLALETFGRFHEAVLSFECGLALDPYSSRAWIGRGRMLTRLGHYEQALHAYDRALSISSLDASQWTRVSLLPEMVTSTHGDTEQTQQVLWHHQAPALHEPLEVESSTDDTTIAPTVFPAPAWIVRGDVLRARGRYADAVQAFEHALALDDQQAHAWIGKGAALFRLRRYDEAAAAFDHAIALDVHDAVAWHSKGSSLRNLGRHTEALHAYDTALILEPEGAVVWNSKAKALEALDRYDEAMAAYICALELDPTLDDAARRLDELRAWQGWPTDTSRLAPRV